MIDSLVGVHVYPGPVASHTEVILPCLDRTAEVPGHKEGEGGEGDHLVGGVQHGRVGGMFLHGNDLALIHTPVGCGKLVHPVRAERWNLPADIDITGAIKPGVGRGDIPLADFLRFVASLVGEHTREPEGGGPVPLHLGSGQFGILGDVTGLAGYPAGVVVHLSNVVRSGGVAAGTGAGQPLRDVIFPDIEAAAQYPVAGERVAGLTGQVRTLGGHMHIDRNRGVHHAR